MKQSRRKIAFVIGTVVASALVVVVWLSISNKEPAYAPGDSRELAQKNEQFYKDSYKKDLEEKDYESYQEGVLALVNMFEEAKDYDGAQERLDRILDNVPESKLNVHSYMALSEVARKRDDTKKYKAYTTTLIEKLKKDGRKAEAEQYSKELAKVQ